jgi:hypothetical protein
MAAAQLIIYRQGDDPLVLEGQANPRPFGDGYDMDIDWPNPLPSLIGPVQLILYPASGGDPQVQDGYLTPGVDGDPWIFRAGPAPDPGGDAG